MTDIEISRALALAIGYLPEHIRVAADCVHVYRPIYESMLFNPDYFKSRWHYFSYKNWGEVGPIAERYNAFPYALRSKDGEFTGQWNILINGGDCIADTAAKAIAMAVIELEKRRTK